MQDLQTREQTIASLLAKGVHAEEIAQIAADEAAHQTLRLACALQRRAACAPAPSTDPSASTRSKAAKRSTPKPKASSRPRSAASPATSTPVPPASATPHSPKVRYRVRNWNAYSSSLVQRGSLTLWFDEAAITAWLANQREGKVGRPTTYADAAIICLLTLKAVYHLPLRQTQGFVASLLQLLDVKLSVPNYSTVCRRAAKVSVSLPRHTRNEPLHVVVDSTGVKVYGEGEWKVCQHGFTKRRRWRKIHVGVDEATGEIVAQATTPSHTSDKAMLPALLKQVEAPIKQVSADGAFDYSSCYEAIAEYGALATIPPRENAAKNEGEIWAIRNEHITRIEQIGRSEWKRECGYHRRSLAETTMFRLKTVFGPSLQSRGEQQQIREVAIRCAILNRMTHLGMPVSQRVVLN